jgi:hypothetical protein
VAGGDRDEIAQIEAALQEWRQGDVTLDPGLFFVHLADTRLPLTREARDTLDQERVEEGVFEVFSTVHGFVVVTQSCDIVRECARSEFVDVCPLVPVNDDDLYKIQKGRLMRYAYVSGVADRRLVADLDRTMVVEKSIIASWSRVSGCRTDAERVAFADALARKRQRFAFPNRFNAGLDKFKDRLKKKRDKGTLEGRLIDALDHVRVNPRPNWDAPQVAVFFWFLLERDHSVEFDEARRVIAEWMKLIALSPPFALAEPSFLLVEQNDMTVRDYLASHKLDYDDISL